jgi:hypothetical protein
MQNKPNFLHFSPKNACLTKNKPNSNPIPERPKMNVSSIITRYYEIISPSGGEKTNPKQSQFFQRQTSQIQEPLIHLIWSHNISGPFENISWKYLHIIDSLLILFSREKCVTIVSLGELVFRAKKGIWLINY